jgi:hypothetical protein
VNNGFGKYKALGCVDDLLIQCLDGKRAHSPPRMRFKMWKNGYVNKICIYSVMTYRMEKRR